MSGGPVAIRPLGASGLRVSEIALGTMSFGAETPAREAASMLAIGRERGVNFIDTADVNTDGRSERLIGRLLRGQRDAWVVCTKLGNPTGPGVLDRGLSRRRVLAACEASLKRLATDHIDIYCADIDDPGTPLAETVAAFGDLIRLGRIRYWGLSNFPAFMISEAVRVADAEGVPRPIMGQPCYNAATRQAEQDYIPACRALGLGVVVYSPLARGVLSAKYGAAGRAPRGSRAARHDRRLMETEFRPQSFALARAFAERARAKGGTAAQFAFRWVLANADVASAIAGPRTLEQWREYLEAPSLPFGAADEAFVTRLVPPGHASTPGYRDPRYPVRGRLVSIAGPNA